MIQTFKTIYFPDYKINNPNARGLTLAFGKNDQGIYNVISSLGSYELRELLGFHSYKKLEDHVKEKNQHINSYCIVRLKKEINKLTKKKAEKNLDPVHVTFKGGKNNPLHKWYSYLEGYSPDFVKYILDKFAPRANVVYDPFSGTGVTAIVAAQRGINSFYSEVNPLLQLLTETKLDISLLSDKKRLAIIKTISNIQENLSEMIRSMDPDSSLLESYKNTFNNSVFFDKETFELVLKARTLVDEISYKNPLAANLLQVAILNALIPSSLLQRAGDVRYKTKKELSRKKDFIETINKNLIDIIDDTKNIETLPARPILLTEGAQDIKKIPKLKIDTVITSPPYLNGTNYFRNTKVELWFLRGIKTQCDLNEFRYNSVTAGINDVTKRKEFKSYSTPEVKEIVEKLQKKAYDSRIPKMVGDYFNDMTNIFSNLIPHLSSQAIVAIDIGDSFYAGVKVPTDELLEQSLENIGYIKKEKIILRKRKSRNGKLLKQVLLIFEAPIKKKKGQVRINKKRPDWINDWNNFKKELPHTKQPFSKRNWGHPLHSLCSYQGKLKPSLAYFLIKTFTKPDQKILDPFAGVGTIPFEAALNGVSSYGFDISPAAIHIARAKIEKIDKERVQRIVERLDNFIKKEDIDLYELRSAQEFGLNRKLKEYYHPKTLEEIVKARCFFGSLPKFTSSESFVIASLLHVLHGNRPYALSRRSHGITPFAPKGEYEYKSLISRLKEKIERNLKTEIPDRFKVGEIRYQDATSWWPKHIKDLDAIITSPPFFDSTRFYSANWLRLWFSGWNNEDFNNQPMGFIDEKQKLGFDVYESVFRQARERLKPGGILVLHLGKSSKCNMSEKISEISTPWFKTIDVFEESVEKIESFGVKDQGAVNKHQFLILS